MQEDKTAQNTIKILEKSGFLFGFGPLPARKLGKNARFVCAMFYFSLKCRSEDIDEEALLFGTPMYFHPSADTAVSYGYGG